MRRTAAATENGGESAVTATTGPRAFAAAVAIACATAASSAQESFSSGQNIAPVYEGWEQNTDGSFTLVFGYFNRNWEEEIDLPVGADNAIEPGGPDQGQPTHFLPRRNRFLFRIRVPRSSARTSSSGR